MIDTHHRTGFSLIEAIVAVAIFLLFAVGTYSALTYVFKVVYQARLETIETALIDEQLELVRNLPYDSVGIVAGIPSGVLPHTQTVVRDGITINLTDTVRNIDDPYDGVAPADTSPADYKLVEIEAICASCTQQQPVTISTRVSPKGLEGADKNGALFINVFDANGLPVVGASVHVVNSSTNPATVVDDVTDDQGYLRIVDAPTGTQAYAITVTKSGYSSDGTVAATTTNTNPVKPPANVVTQGVTNISFSIDHTGTITYHTLAPTCAAKAAIPFSVMGTKLIGSNPNVYKYNKNLTSDSGGNLSVTNAEWDSYAASVSGTAYDLAGSIPTMPFSLLPGGAEDVTLLVVPHTTNTFLVTVLDAGTGLPLSNATVELSGGSYDQSELTGLGYARQTDWSGGSGQTTYLDPTEYFADDGNVAVSSPAGDVKLRKSGSLYASSGFLESATFDLGTQVNFDNIIFTPTSQPTSTGSTPVQMQIATSNSSTPGSWNFAGPDGTASTYYSPAIHSIASSNNGNEFLRYRLFLSTSSSTVSPDVGELAFTYTTGCTPPGQSFFSGLSNGTYTLSVVRTGYATVSNQVTISGSGQAVVNLSSN